MIVDLKVAGEKITAADLRLADTVIDPGNVAAGVMVVSNIREGGVEFTRPYPTTADFSYTGGVIVYTGLEVHWDHHPDGEFVLLHRKELK